MDKARIAATFARAAQSYEQEAIAQRAVVDRLMVLIDSMAGMTSFRRVLEIGSGTGLLTRRIQAKYAPSEFFVNDLSAEMAASCPPDAQFLPGDAEILDFPGDLDAIVSASALQWFRDPAAFIRRAATRLRPGGLLALATFGPANLSELKALTGNGLTPPAPEALRAMAQAAFNLVYIEGDTITLTFPDTLSVLRHLRRTGVNGLSDPAWHPARLRALCREYEARFAVPGGVRLTYDPVYLLARA